MALEVLADRRGGRGMAVLVLGSEGGGQEMESTPRLEGFSFNLGGGRIKASRRVLQRRLILRSGDLQGAPLNTSWKHHQPCGEWGATLLKKKKPFIYLFFFLPWIPPLCQIDADSQLIKTSFAGWWRQPSSEDKCSHAEQEWGGRGDKTAETLSGPRLQLNDGCWVTSLNQRDKINKKQ